MNKKIMVTGADGFLASRIINYYERKYEICGRNRMQMDFTDADGVLYNFEQDRPDIVIHCGAISDVGACDKNPELSYRVNITGAENMAKACAKYQSKLIFCSSDQVYFGSKKETPHNEEERLVPPHIYGLHKLKAEQLCMEENSNTIALRLSWMYDWEKKNSQEHGSLISNIREAIEKGENMKYPIHDFRSITNVWEAVGNLDKVFDIPPGIYNFGSPNDVSTYDVVKCILQHINTDSKRLYANKEAYAEKPRNLRMDISKIEKYGILFRSTCKAIGEYQMPFYFDIL